MADAPYTGASVRIDGIYAYPGLIGATRPAFEGYGGSPPGGQLPKPAAVGSAAPAGTASSDLVDDGSSLP
jgi:hypothetical protein